MKHFICTGGCGGEAGVPGVCQAEDCKKEGEPLLSCACSDGLHNDAQEEVNDPEDEV
jgi:hypothetical protein